MENKGSKFSGMKKNPYSNSPKNAIRNKEVGKKRKKKSSNGSVSSKKGLSPYQVRTQAEFMKVREGETTKQWLWRTRFRRLRTEEELAITQNGRKILEKIRMKRNKTTKKKLQVYAQSKNFNFLKYYVFIINWAATKHDIAQTDLEIGFHFYDNIPFTKEQFCNKCLLFSNSNKHFTRFKNMGYIRPIFTIVNNEGEKKPTGLYKLSVHFVNILTMVYEKLAYQSNFNFRPSHTKTIPPQLEELIIKMAEENNEIITGKKQPDKILIHKTEKNEQY
ncbi:MAG TPA: hypothetical protein VIV55_10125 [Flavobacterium sp.]